jgi:hypothetical protein
VKFARGVFLVAGIYGLLVITPLYFLESFVGKRNPPPITHPEFYYGFVGLALAWEIAFLVIAYDPVRLRPMMWPSMVEKFCYPVATSLLYFRGRLDSATWYVSLVDLIFLVLFALSWWRTGNAAKSIHEL